MRALIILLLFSNIAFGQKKYYPKLNSKSKIELFLSSNISNTKFIVDGKELLNAKRGTVLIDKKPHTIIAHPDGYTKKEAYIQPPYKNKRASLSFTFMIQDKVEYQKTYKHNFVINEGSIDKFQNKEKTKVIEIISDVDEYIPSTSQSNTQTFALIIGNEDYSSFQTGLTDEVNVSFAEKDAKYFKLYVNQCLGVPESNIIFITNATSGQMRQSIAKLNAIASKTGGNANLIFYYAGHGLPDEVTKDAYLIPVDVSGSSVQYGIKLEDLYQSLVEHPVKKATVFIDACFSGGARNQGLIAARGVKIKPKKEQLKGNLIVFTASSGDQSSLPYKEKGHGIFTYYLLKKLQETKGEVEYGKLADYIKQQVSLQSVLINSKEQDPQVNVSPSAIDNWASWTFKE